jgi:hypothetical protein
LIAGPLNVLMIYLYIYIYKYKGKGDDQIKNVSTIYSYDIFYYIYYIWGVGSGGGSHCSYPIRGPCIATVMILLQRSRYDEQCIAMTKKRLAQQTMFLQCLIRMRRPSTGQVLTHTAISYRFDPRLDMKMGLHARAEGQRSRSIV